MVAETKLESSFKKKNRKKITNVCLLIIQPPHNIETVIHELNGIIFVLMYVLFKLLAFFSTLHFFFSLHYKPNADVLFTPLPWEHNFGYTTPSPPFDYSSCANDILKDCSVNPATTRPDYPIDIQYRGHVTPPGLWSPYVTSSIQPAPVRSCMFSNYPFFPQTQVTNQQLTLL